MLLTRILTALVLLPAVIASLFLLPPVAFDVLLLVFALAGAWEWSRLAGLAALPARVAVALAAGALALVGLELAAAGVALVAVATVWWLLALAVLAGEHVPRLVAVLHSRNVQVLLAVMVPAATVAALAILFADGARPWLVITVMVIVWAADIGAYFAGRAFGRTPLAPRISPKKTWEGAVGGALAALAAGIPMVIWQTAAAPWVAGVLVAVLVVASVVGDLVESAWKRHAGVKDSGNLLPGHGGVLDRVDSLLAAAPLMAAFVLVSGG